MDFRNAQRPIKGICREKEILAAAPGYMHSGASLSYLEAVTASGCDVVAETLSSMSSSQEKVESGIRRAAQCRR